MANDASPLVPLQGVLRDLGAWLRASKVRHVIIGGVAAAVLGRPRVTRDVDALIWLDQSRWADLIKVAERFGLRPRISDVLGFAAQSRVLLLHHKPSGIDVDVSCGILPFEDEALSRAIRRRLGSVTLSLPTAEDLIIMKAVAQRPRDLADIEGIVDACPKLDLRRVRRWIKEFADVMEMPELAENFESILRKARSRRRRK